MMSMTYCLADCVNTKCYRNKLQLLVTGSLFVVEMEDFSKTCKNYKKSIDNE